MQRVKSSNVTSIDALAKNLINRNNKSLNCSVAETMTKTPTTNTHTATSAAITAIAKASENLLNRKKSLSNNNSKM
jgi:hypothetical protein